jgi:hypothetical protein
MARYEIAKTERTRDHASVFVVVYEGTFDAVSQHQTEAGAKQAIRRYEAADERREKQWSEQRKTAFVGHVRRPK